MSSFAVTMAASGDAKAVPEKFFGSFKLEKSENFDEFLSSKGVNWFIRKMIQMTSITKQFKPATGKPGKFTAINLSRKANTEWDFTVGEEFEAQGLDGTKHKIKFDVPDENTLTEYHLRVEMPGDTGETYYYTREGDYLILKMENNNITCRRFFKSVPEGEAK
uniref:FABP domain-containing protein n=1 Tax=Panagrellus redivivus TaxID=6233 RepID=A0A7E4VX29_PANRE